MNFTRKITIFYSLLGAFFGIISNFLPLTFALIVPIIFYSISLKFFIKGTKRFKENLINSLISFFTIWLIVWITIFNL